jgi:proton-dependent oligopeptide transporter, POT family
LGLSDANAAGLYGLYTGSAWAAAIVGGAIADRWLGQYRSVLSGGVLIATGHFLLAFESYTTFLAGLVSIVAGTGLLKQNVSTLIGSLYGPKDPRRDAGFAIF